MVYELNTDIFIASLLNEANINFAPRGDINIEVKRSQTLNIEKAMQQSTEDAGNNKTPIVVHRKNNEKWKVTMWLDDYMELKGFKKVKE